MQGQKQFFMIKITYRNGRGYLYWPQCMYISPLLMSIALRVYLIGVYDQLTQFAKVPDILNLF